MAVGQGKESTFKMLTSIFKNWRPKYTFSWMDLPPELQAIITSSEFLDNKSWYNCLLVCKDFMPNISHDEYTKRIQEMHWYKLDKVREYLEPVHENIASVELVELKDDSLNSYIDEKTKIYLRLGDYPKECLGYVFLHCFAFTLCEEYGHTLKWRGVFNLLVGRAQELGIELKNPTGQELY